MTPNSGKTESYKIQMLQLQPASAQEQLGQNDIHGRFLAVGKFPKQGE